MPQSYYWKILIGMFVVGLLPRVIPLLLLKGREIPPKFQTWMSFIPVAIFTSLIFSDIFFYDGGFNLDLIHNVKLIPSIIVFFVAFKSKNLFISMLTGVVAMALMIGLT